LLAVLVALVGGLTTVTLPGSAAADATLETGTALPAIPAGMKVINLGLDGSTAYAGMRALPGTSTDPLTIYRTASDGTDEGWTAVTDPSTGSPLQQAFVPQVGEGRILVSGPEDQGTPCPDYRIIGSVSRSFESCVPPRLVDGGRLIRGDTASSWRLDNTDGTLIDSFSRSPVVDGGRAWWVTSFPGGQVVGRDLSTGDPLGPLPVKCEPTGLPTAGGGYVLVPCSGSGVTSLADGLGTLPSYPLASGLWRTGNGFAARQALVPGGTVLQVVDFGQGKTTHEFATSSIGRSAADSGGSARVIFETPDLGIAVGDLGTLAPRNVSAEDVTVPTVSFDSAPAPFLPTAGAQLADLDYVWTGADGGLPTNALRYDVRESNEYVDTAPTYYPVRTGTAALSYTVSAQATSTRMHCVQVRAQDWAGNTSDWTAPACTLVDGERPFVEWTMRSFNPFLSGLSSTPVTLSWDGVDEGGLTTSRLSQRVALPGEVAGSWQVPSGWNVLTKTSVSRTYRAGLTVCFRVQMRDRAGNLSFSTYAGTQCRSIPYDDRSFTAVGTAHRGRSSLMLGGTYTRLAAGDAWLVRKGLRVRALDLRISGDWTTHPRVYLGSKRIDPDTWASYSGAKVHWIRYFFGRTLSGTLRIRGDKYKPFVVDAIAVEH
jgi:hypothetical protein